VNVFDNDIIQQMVGCNILMWHHHHAIFQDTLAAKKILFALEHAGITVFPDFNTAWHFDDKVAQKYLLELVKAPAVPSYVFYDQNAAISWANQTAYPKIFKLKGGAGASNVRMVNSRNEALRIIKLAFGRGFSQYDRLAGLKERFRKYQNRQEPLTHVLKGVLRLFYTTNFSRNHPKERGYVYFQEFMPDNNSDLRIIVIKEKAFGVRRLVRENDFRASGSGKIEFDKDAIDMRAVAVAFQVNEKLDAQSIAFDFINGRDGAPLVVEISYGFSMLAYDNCPGYWDKNLKWHQGAFNPQEWMIESILSEQNVVEKKNS
tara:strand:+ start:432 stop:1382 length:951 start_codon:yes stop_codon:yes gene_type:complete